MKRIGVFVCHCGLNIGGTIDIDRVVEEIKKYPGVVHADQYKYLCSDPGQIMVKDAVGEHDLDGVVVANCSPTLHEVTFRNAVAAVGLNPYLCEVANIREQCSWAHAREPELATRKAIRLIEATVEKVKRNRSLYPLSMPVTRKALVIGGGVAGIQAALDIADAGIEVYLVEKTSSIGGRMVQLSETFPTLDCPQCIMTPKMVAVAQHPKINLLAYSEVESVSGYVGNFDVRVRRRAAFIDWEKCTGCGACAEVCPVEMWNEFDRGLSRRTAVYRPFPQAVPNKFVIDRKGTPPCQAACPLHVNAQGYTALISAGKFREALALVRERNPFPGITGRICHHPCEAACERATIDEAIAIDFLKRFVADKEDDLEWDLTAREEREERVAIVGSGPAGLMAAYDLSRRGYRVTVFEALPVLGGMLAVGIPPYRLPRELLESEIGVLKRLGVEFKLNTPIGKERTLTQLTEEGYGAIFLAIGAHVSRKLGVEGEDLEGFWGAVEFLRAVNLGEEVKVGKRAAVIGGGNAAVDAARTLLRLGSEEVSIVYRRSRVEMPAMEREVDEAEREGIRILYLTLPSKVMGRDGKVAAMECVRMELGEPDESGRRRPIPIEGSEFTIEIDMVVPAISQSPQIAGLGEELGLGISRWGSIDADPLTLATNIPGVFAGGDGVTGPKTYIEAMAQGRKAAISIDRYLRGEDLTVDREGEGPFETDVRPDTRGVDEAPRAEMPTLEMGERTRNFREVDLGFTEEQAVAEAKRCLNCAGCSECKACVAACEVLAIQHEMEDEFVDLDVGAIVVATGYDLYDEWEGLAAYGYGTSPDIVTALEFERLLAASGPTAGEVRRPSDGEVPKEVVFVNCVGSRDPETGVPYCSRVCCMYTAKEAMLYKHRVHDGQAYVFYIDIRSNGKGYEEFVQRGMEEEGILFLRGKVSRIFQEDGKVMVWGVDTLSGRKVEVAADMVVLANAIVPNKGVKELAKLLRIGTDEFGFLKEAHLKLRPVETLTAGIFIAGMAQSPKDITDSVSQASGAAMKVCDLLSGDELAHEPTVASVDPELCRGCGYCEAACAYGAVTVDLVEKIAKVTEMLCEGCGGCSVACPSGAISHTNFSSRQYLEMIDVVTEDY